MSSSNQSKKPGSLPGGETGFDGDEEEGTLVTTEADLWKYNLSKEQTSEFSVPTNLPKGPPVADSAPAGRKRSTSIIVDGDTADRTEFLPPGERPPSATGAGAKTDPPGPMPVKSTAGGAQSSQQIAGMSPAMLAGGVALFIVLALVGFFVARG